MHVYQQSEDGNFYYHSSHTTAEGMNAACEEIQHAGRIFSVEDTYRGLSIAYDDSTFAKENPPYILEGNTVWNITKEQAEQLSFFIYFCDEDKCYHIAPSFMHAHGDDPEKAMNALEEMLK